MGRKKERNAVKVNFNLDVEVNEKLKENARFENVGQSEFIEMLIIRWDEGINPQSKLNALFKKRAVIDQQLKDIDLQIKELNDHIIVFNEIRREKSKRKPEALEILIRLLEKGNMEEAERISRFWQKQTGVSSFELLMEAKEMVEKKNIFNYKNNLDYKENENHIVEKRR